MLYVCGIMGFLLGFLSGQMFLSFMLRGVSRKEILENKHIQMKYGLLNWGFAIFGGYVASTFYLHISG